MRAPATPVPRSRRTAAAVVAVLLLGPGWAGCAVDGEGRSAGTGTTTPAAPQAAPVPPAPPTSRDATPAAPESVRLPSLGLDEDLVRLGLTRTGALEVPTDPARVGWFTGGGRPGGPGPTVLVGHLDSAEGPAVFARLTELAPGDVAVVRLTDGSEVRYRVDAVEDHPQQPFPTEAVFGATAEDSLRLVTCTGPYDSAAGRYTENRVVYASALGPPS